MNMLKDTRSCSHQKGNEGKLMETIIKNEMDIGTDPTPTMDHSGLVLEKQRLQQLLLRRLNPKLVGVKEANTKYLY